jgi:hypothetical protein
MEYDAKSQCFLLDDGKSVAAVFELTDVPSEVRSDAYLLQLQQGLQGIFQDVFPAYHDDESPWILQFYVQDELSLKSFYESFEQYVKPSAQNSLLTENYLALLKQHTELMTKPDGLFVDSKVSGEVFRGRVRKVRVVMYRWLSSKTPIRAGRTAVQDLNGIASAFCVKLEGCGVKIKRYTGKEFYEWLVTWFNPSPAISNNKNNKSSEQNPIDQLLAIAPYPSDKAMPFGYDFAEKCFFSTPRSDSEKGVWYFDNLPHRYLSITGLNHLPQVGHLTRERLFGNYWRSLFDSFPVGSIFQMTVVIQSQEVVKNHLFRIDNSTKRATSTEAEMAKEDVALARRAIESGNYFFPTSLGVYVQGKSLMDLTDKITSLETLLLSHGFSVVHSENELVPIDSYLRYLPMNYHFNFDKKYYVRSRYLSGQQLAQLLPLYGRERGTGHPLISLFNRGGEPFTFDPINPLE